MKHALLMIPFVLLAFAPLREHGDQPLFAEDDAGATSATHWNAVKTYRYGDDFKPLLAVEAEVRRSVASPEARAQTAARLAELLNDETTYPGRQFVCLQLRLVGGPAEVPKLAEYLNRPEDSENARLALTDILCEESLVPLRKALETFQGRVLVGIIGSLAARNDRASIPAFARLIDDPDKEVAAAAISALGRFGAEGVEVLINTKGSAATGTSLIRIASDLADQGKKDAAAQLYETLASDNMPKGVRRAALEGQLRLLDAELRKETISAWLFEDDFEKGIIAASHLTEFSGEQLNDLFHRIAGRNAPDRIAGRNAPGIETMNAAGRTALLEIASESDETATLDELLRSVESDDAVERLTALRAIGKRGEAQAIPVLIAALGQDETAKSIARDALVRFPAQAVGPQLLEAIQQPASRDAAIDVIVAIKYYDAIDPMIPLAKSEDDAVAAAAIAGLGRLCDPDDHDLPRLLALHRESRPGTHRENVERAIVVVCEKLPDASERADKLLAILDKQDGGFTVQVLIDVLPLLGKVGNKRVAEMIRPLLEAGEPALQRAAIRALCNWPNADYLDDLWKIASEHPSGQYRRWALRAYIRVATLKSDRPEIETLAMLQKSMAVANDAADRQWCLSRAATVRTMESADWAASFLNDPVLSQTACTVIVELAHHRFLREPNKARFEPILLKVEQTAQDKDIVERAKKSRLGM